MPLTQTKLDFGAGTALRRSNRPSSIGSALPIVSRSSLSSSETVAVEADSDAMAVDKTGSQSQLPTPAESTFDPLAEAIFESELPKATQGKTRLLRHKSKSSMKEQAHEVDDITKGRSVSGETLVTNTSQTSLLRKGIAALDLPWSVTSLAHFPEEKEEAVSKQLETPEESTKGEDRSEIGSSWAARREENDKLWEAKKEAEESKATRRSSRASILGKAGSTVSDLTAGALAKRPREAVEKTKDRLGALKRHGSLRPKSMAGPLPGSTPSFSGPTTKARRLSDGDIGKTSSTGEGFTIPRKPVPVRKDKRYLETGLYVGQTRDFDGRFSESKNKRRHDAAPPVEDNKLLPLPMFAGERLLKNGRDYKLPFNLFSPLPPGQPRPDEWRKTNKNVFIGDAGQVWRHSKPREHSTCMCTEEDGCDDNCMNRYMFYECDEGNCKISECANRSFNSLAQRTKKGGKYQIGVEVLQTTDRGFGVRSNRCFDANQIIVEYTGEIITQDECDQRMRTIYKNNECYYLMLFDQNMIIDATRGSIARFVNHSCEPNCRMEKWIVGGKPRMALFASKPIMTGDELTYDYNFDPFSQKNVQECRCGTTRCRGVLGPKPKDEKKANVDQDAKPSTKGKLAGAKRKMTEILDEGTDKWNKRPKITAPRSAVVALKKVSASSTAKKNDKAAKQNTSQSQSSPPRQVSSTGLFKKPSLRATRALKEGVIDQSARVMKRKTSTADRRAVSNSSVTEALIAGKPVSEQKLGRTGSLRAKAASIREGVVRTVRGAAGKGERSLRPGR